MSQAPLKEPSRLALIVRWLLAIPAGFISMVAWLLLTLVFIFVMSPWPWLWQMYGGDFMKGVLVGGFVWGGALMAPNSQWWVRALIFIGAATYFMATSSLEWRRHDALQIVIGGVVGMLLVGPANALYIRLKRVREINVAQNLKIAEYLRQKRQAGVPFLELCRLYLRLSFPFKWVQRPDDAPVVKYANPFRLNLKDL